MAPPALGVRPEPGMAGRRDIAVRMAVPSGPCARRVAEYWRMTETRFWLIRHALVDENSRAILYGVMDVPLCETTLEAQAPMYTALARRLPRPAVWKVTPLSRTRRTAQTIFDAGYPAREPGVEPDLIEQSLGEWQGLPHAELPAKLAFPQHPFWPLAGDEKPPGGESMVEVIVRAG